MTPARFKSWIPEGDELRPDELRYLQAADMLKLQEELNDPERRARELQRWREKQEQKSKPKDLGNSQAKLPRCVEGVKAFTRTCGHRQAVVLRCGKPTCPECERLRSQEAQAAWGPVVEKMKHPKMLVLAVVSNHSLLLALVTLLTCFARFMDLRIGGRAREKYRQQTQAFIDAHVAEFDKHHADDPERRSAVQWRASCDKFWDVDIPRQAARKKAKNKSKSANAQAFKVRDLLRGVRVLEVTWNIFNGWHPHFHCAVDSIYLPFPALLMLWQQACTVNGQTLAALADPDEELAEGEVIGRTAHVSALRDVREVMKYVTKHQDYERGEGEAPASCALPADKRLELEMVLHGRKRIWGIGGAKPVELPKAVCPSCKEPGCKCDEGESIGQYLTADIWKDRSGQFVKVTRASCGGLTWERLTWAERGEAAPLFNTTGGCLTVPTAAGPPLPDAGP